MNNQTAASVDQLLAAGFSQRATAAALGIGKTSVARHLAKPSTVLAPTPEGRLSLSVPDGVVLVGSDAHIWPGPASTAWRALMWASRTAAHGVPIKAVILNGDVMDLPQLSKYPSIGWEHLPTVAEQIAATQERLNELEGPWQQIWTIGNHDLRFETRLAERAVEFANVQGIHLKDHFSAWTPALSCWINDDVVIKHRFKGGPNATYNNTLHSGLSIVTGHLHSLRVSPFSDYRGTRFGVDTGTLAVPHGPQFVDYTEDNPVNWRSGFAILTFRDGRLMWPEVCYVIDEAEGLVGFRGQVIRV